MQKTTQYIDLDFLPPTAELICSIPERAKEENVETICLKIVDNFPWDFDGRLRSFSSYDESMIDFISKESKKLGIRLIIKFPEADDFLRLLRLQGYRRLLDINSKQLKIKTSSVGFKPLIESAADDFISLFPELEYFGINKVSDNDSDYKKHACDILSKEGYKLFEIDSGTRFITAEEFLFGVESGVIKAYQSMNANYKAIAIAGAEVQRLLIMSSLTCNPPAPGGSCINSMMNQVEGISAALNKNAATLKKEAKGHICEEWIDTCIKACILASEEELRSLEQRLVQFNLLN